ncbi:MAG: nicotinamide riboside transporter PnuC [Clostridia bacterium]|nr:nicotinamide riboside transporter PnuC [Clostridia bacterium]
MLKKILDFLSVFEWILFSISLVTVIVCFFIFDGKNYLYLSTFIIGVFYLIFCAKGHPIGQVLVIVFAILYSIISYRYKYYGEMITYLGMTGGIAILSLISWLKHPTSKNDKTVVVNKLKIREYLFLIGLSVIVTTSFYYLLKALGTSNIVISTISVLTSFIASYLTLRRSKYYAVAYLANDIVLIAMWSLASLENKAYISVTICFVVFFVNDLYGFISWWKREQKQENHY